MRAHWASLSVACLLASCALDLGENDGVRCTSFAECAPGGACYRGFCVSSEGATCPDEGATLDCYTGPAGTEEVGPCRAGVRVCLTHVLSSCHGEIVPGLEVCNAVDDDCDGHVDETVSPACYPEGLAGCAIGDGGFACIGVCAPGRRSCDDQASSTCVGPVVPAAGDGCTAGGSTAQDDDCDGRTDEDCACAIGSSQPCYDGPVGTAGVGGCAAGAQVCEGDGALARYGTCNGMRAPVEESCSNAGADDDCDGTVDDVPGLATPCVVAERRGLCHDGALACDGDVQACVTPTPRAELCDGLDDDCDGDTDESFDLRTDPMNCGACGHACGAGSACCDGVCLDVTSSVMHCGGCRTRCDRDEACCAGTCTDLADSRTHCGTCGHTCGGGESCSDGLCCPRHTRACGDTCIDEDEDCEH